MDFCKANMHIPKVKIYTTDTRQILFYFGRYVAKARLFRLKSVIPVTGLECSVTTWGHKNRDPEIFTKKRAAWPQGAHTRSVSVCMFEI